MTDKEPETRAACEIPVPKRSLKLAIGITAGIFFAEVAGGFLSGSLALLGDAAHMLQDTIALLLSLGAILIAERLPTPSRTFGYHRVEIGVAIINGVLLFSISIFIVLEAIERFSSPAPINSTLMFTVAAAGLAANIASMYVLRGSHDLNIRSAFLHVAGDTISSVAVIAAAIWIAFTGQTIVDPLLSIAIAVLIVISSFSLLSEASRILLQFAPRDISTEAVIREMESVAGVSGVHDVHLWSLCSNINVLDAHVYTPETDPRRIESVKQEIKQRLEKFRIRHSTLEFEFRECEDCRVVQELKD